jgi:hypothetical protein
MLDRKRNLNKLIHILKLAEARKARRIESFQTTNQADHQATIPAARKPVTLRSHLTDTEALARKVRAEMVRDAQAAFAALMTELNTSQTRHAPLTFDDCENAIEETDEAIASQRLIQADRVGDA